MTKITFSVLLVLLAYGCFASGEVVLKGRVGDSAVVLHLYYNESTCSGNFFFANSLFGIEFSGRKKDNDFWFPQMEALHGGHGADTIAVFSLTPKNDTQWLVKMFRKQAEVVTGTLRACSVRHVNQDSAYDNEKRALFQATEIERKKINGIALTVCGIDKSDIRFVRIESGVPDAALKKINSSQREMADAAALQFFGCTSANRITDYGFELSHLFVTGSILSLEVSGSYYCNNASIEDWSRSYNYDLSSGYPIELDQVLGLDSLKQKEEGDDDHFPSDEFCDRLVDLLTDLYPQQMEAPEKDQRCDYTSPDIWRYGSWYFTQEGMFLQPLFRHQEMECGEEVWSVIPYKTIRKYKAKNFKPALPGN